MKKVFSVLLSLVMLMSLLSVGVAVSAAAVPEPVKIRYNYSDNPTCNLFNKAGFPAAPFETK